MSNNLGTNRLSNEQLLLINILNTMYNDNLRQINSITDILNNILDTNNQIRSLLVQLLNSNQNNIGQNNSNYNNRRNRNNNRFYNSDRGQTENRTYIDIISTLGDGFTLPLRPTGNYINRENQNNIFTQLLQSFLQPIEIYPTQSQIEAATRRVRYSDITRPINSQCPISMDNFNDNDMVTVIRHCGHIFNTENLNSWFRSNCRCPVCRYDIRDYNTNASTEYFTTNAPQNNNSNNLQRTNSEERNTNNFLDNNNNNNNDILSSRVLDLSGNMVNISYDILASYITNAFDRGNFY